MMVFKLYTRKQFENLHFCVKSTYFQTRRTKNKCFTFTSKLKDDHNVVIILQVIQFYTVVKLQYWLKELALKFISR